MFFKNIFKSNKEENKKINGDTLVKQAISEYEKDSDEFEVIKKLKLALELGIENYSLDKVYLYLGFAYKDIGENEIAIEYLEKGLEINPKNSKVVTKLGSLYDILGKQEEAYKLYYESLKLMPENSILYNNVGVYYHKKGNHLKALEYFDVALRFNSALVVAYSNKARSLAYIGNYEEANRFAKIAKLRDYEDYNQLMTEIQDIKIDNPAIYLDRNKYIEFVIQISENNIELISTIFNIIDTPLDFFKQNEIELETKLYTSFEIVNSLHIYYLIEYLKNLNKVLIFDNSENCKSILKNLESLITSQIDVNDDFFEEFFDKIDDYSILDLLISVASKLKLLHKYDMLDIWSNPYNYNIVLLESEKWEKINYPYTIDVFGVGVIRNLATPESVNDFINN